MALSMFENYGTSSESNMSCCHDDYIIIGTTTEHSFSIDLDPESISKILVSYSQILDGENHVVLEKEFTGYDIEEGYLTFQLNEFDTLSFNSEVDALVQLKVILNGGSILASRPYYLEILTTNNSSALAARHIEELRGIISGTSITIDKFILLAGTTGAYRVNFSLDSSWDNLTLKAVFKNTLYNKMVTVDLDGDNSCMIPDDIISSPCRLSISVVGSDENIIKSTEWSKTLFVVDTSLSKKIVVGDE